MGRSSPGRGVLAARFACLIGIGLARFAYTPLIPALIAAGWFTPGAAAYLGAGNLLGYLAGAVLGRPAASRVAPAPLLRGAMLLASVSFLASALPAPFAWFLLWRFAAGLAGGAIMVLAATEVLPRVPAAHRGLAGGVVFAGVGLGVVASGTLVPLLLRSGLTAAWCGLGVLALLLTALSWTGWPDTPPRLAASAVAPRAPARIAPVLLEYGLNAVVLVPHMVFLVDFVARGLGRGMVQGSAIWVAYGCGAATGPMLLGRLADRMGARRALRLGFVVQALAVGLPLAATGAAWLALSGLVVGGFTPGSPALVLARLRDLLADDHPGQQAAWSRATIVFSVFQAVAAYGASAIFARSGGGYRVLFACGAAAALLALAVDLLSGGTARRAAAAPVGRGQASRR